MPISSVPKAATIRLEHRLLLLCARAHLTPTQRSKFNEAWAEKPDWKYLRPRFTRNGLLPLLMHHVQESGATVPDAVLQVLQTDFARGLQLRLNLLSELKQVTHLLTSRGFPVLAYKGPVMAQAAYGSMALRPFADLDLLISPEHSAEIVVLLESNGYQREHTPLLPPHLQKRREAADYEMTLLPRQGFGALDVHWKVAAAHERFELSFQEMWERRVAAELDPSIFTLCREDLILCLCSHGVKHMWHRLEWISCLLALIETESVTPLDWEQLEARARSLQCRRILYLGLRLIIDLAEFGRGKEELFSAVPPALRQAVEADRGVEKLARQAWDECLHPERNAEISLSWALLMFSVRVRDNWKLRLLYLIDIVKAHLLPHQEDAETQSRSMGQIYLRRLQRILVRRLQRWGVLRRS